MTGIHGTTPPQLLTYQPDDVLAVGQAFRAGAVTVEAVRTALDAAVLVALRPGHGAAPGVVVFAMPSGGRWVAVFTSLDRLARFAARRGQTTVDWLSAGGSDLIPQLPPEVGLIVDPGEEHCVVLPAPWLSTGAGSERVIDPLTVNSRT